jgi:hypothetical protein
LKSKTAGSDPEKRLNKEVQDSCGGNGQHDLRKALENDRMDM